MRLFLQKKKELIIYVGKSCHDCKEVIETINKHKASFEVIDIDKGGKKPPLPLFVFPSLFKDEKLIAYGFDIIDWFKVHHQI
jgi:glutaredoxin